MRKNQKEKQKKNLREHNTGWKKSILAKKSYDKSKRRFILH
jgi:hypothetical protein